MKNRRSKFLTVLFAFLPGAGHMFLGFMKSGVSLMSLFFGVIALGILIHLEPLFFLIPIIWFYAFFDCINKRFCSDEEFEDLSDGYMFSLDKLFAGGGKFLQKRNLILGIILLFLGAFLLWDNVLRLLRNYLPYYIVDNLTNLTSLIPKLFFGVLIIVIGIKLVMGKKREADADVERS